LTGDKKHRNYTTGGQRVSRSRMLSGPTLLYFLFSQPHIFLNSILPTAQVAQWVLPYKLADPSQNQKCLFFANALMTTMQL